MDAARIDLIAYHFGTCDDDERAATEQHLLTCSECLGAYLALKRHVDGAARGERPSDVVRERLRRDVAAAFPTRPARHALAWLARPIPLYQGALAAALALVVAALAPAVGHRSLPRTHHGEQVDTSRVVAESLTTY